MRSLKRVLDPEVEVVAMVDNLASLLDSIESLEPSFAVVDLDLLGPDPARVLHVLRSRAACPPLIGLSAGEIDEEGDVRSELAVVIPREQAGQALVPATKEVLGDKNKQG